MEMWGRETMKILMEAKRFGSGQQDTRIKTPMGSLKGAIQEEDILHLGRSQKIDLYLMCSGSNCVKTL